MKRTKWLGITILVFAAGLIVGYFVYAVPQNNPWYGLSCEEMFGFAMSTRHQELTMEQHMEFHKSYDPCIQNMDTDKTENSNTSETIGFAKITNVVANLAPDTLFLSVTVADNLPQDTEEGLLDKDAVGFGYAWLGPDDAGQVDLIGVLANVHLTNYGSSKALGYWHVEPVSIEFGGVKSELCIFTKQPIGEVFVSEDTVTAILPLNDVHLSLDELDRVLSLEIVQDHGCSSGLGGNIIYRWIETSSISKIY